MGECIVFKRPKYCQPQAGVGTRNEKLEATGQELAVIWPVWTQKRDRRAVVWEQSAWMQAGMDATLEG
jgi:hypothetical protein